MLASGEGIKAVTLYNNRGDKTHIIGEGSHFGWMPHSNVLLCPSVALGTCALYRFTARREAFPEVCADNGGKNPGYQWKWLPLLITTADTYEVDAEKSQLPIQRRQTLAVYLLQAALRCLQHRELHGRRSRACRTSAGTAGIAERRHRQSRSRGSVGIRA